jgi:hypothetical protein
VAQKQQRLRRVMPEFQWAAMGAQQVMGARAAFLQVIQAEALKGTVVEQGPVVVMEVGAAAAEEMEEEGRVESAADNEPRVRAAGRCELYEVALCTLEVQQSSSVFEHCKHAASYVVVVPPLVRVRPPHSGCCPESRHSTGC